MRGLSRHGVIVGRRLLAATALAVSAFVRHARTIARSHDRGRALVRRRAVQSRAELGGAHCRPRSSRRSADCPRRGDDARSPGCRSGSPPRGRAATTCSWCRTSATRASGATSVGRAISRHDRRWRRGRRQLLVHGQRSDGLLARRRRPRRNHRRDRPRHRPLGRARVRPSAPAARAAARQPRPRQLRVLLRRAPAAVHRRHALGPGLADAAVQARDASGT